MFEQFILDKILVLYSEGCPIENIAMWTDISPKEINSILDKIVPYL